LNCSTSGATGCTACGTNLSIVAGTASNTFGGLAYCKWNVSTGFNMIVSAIALIASAVFML